MIKIQEHLNRHDADLYLDFLADEHWKALNPIYKSKPKFKPISIIEKCKKHFQQAGNNDYIKTFADNNKKIAYRHKSLFHFFIDNNFKELKRIIIARPDDFNNIINDIFSIIQEEDLYFKVSGKIVQSEFGKLLSNVIFDYTSYRNSDNCIQLYTSLGFTNLTCPYCNDRKIEIIKRNETSLNTNNIAYFDLDHFYSKSKNPFFALSFFNLIPCCHICNSIEKGNKHFTIETHIHPYYEAFDDFYNFKISLKTLLGDPIDEIKFETKIAKANDRTILDLNLHTRYNHRFKETEDLIIFYLNNYKKCTSTNKKTMFLDALFNLKNIPSERKFILNNERGKLFRDVLKQIDIKNHLNIL